MSRSGRIITEQEVTDIMLLNVQGKTTPNIAYLLDIPYYRVLNIIKQNNGIMGRKGSRKSTDNSTKKEQAKNLWESGLHNVDLIAKKIGATHQTTLIYLNTCHRIKTKEINPIFDNDIIEVFKKSQKGENIRGQYAEIAKKYNCSRQWVSLRLKQLTAEPLSK